MDAFVALKLEQKIIFIFLLAELVLATAFVLISYLVKCWSLVQKKLDKKKMLVIRKYFEQNGSHNAPPLNDLALFFQELSETTLLCEQEKRDLVRNYVLKRVRPFLHTKKWLKRYYLLEAYGYCIEAQDVGALIKLIQDERPVISLNAARVSAALASAAVYQAIIEKLTNSMDRSTQSLYIAQFDKSPVLLKVLRDNIADSTDINIKTLCYKIVAYLGPSQEFYNLALKDVDSLYGDCQLAAIPVLALADPDKARRKLFEMLKSDDWLIRNKAVQSIGEINAKDAIDKLARCLDDKNYWVRISAAKALLNFGDAGRSVLAKHKNLPGLVSQDLSAYFIDIDKIKRKL